MSGVSILDWLYDNRTWLFEGIGVVIIVAVATWIWRRIRADKSVEKKQEGVAEGVAVSLDQVKVKGKTRISGLHSTDKGLNASKSTFGELEATDVHISPSSPTADVQPTTPIIGNQLHDVRAGGDLTVESHVHLPDDPSRVQEADLRHAYLGFVLAQADQLPLAGVDRQTASSADAQLQLSAVYTALLTQAPDLSEADVRRVARGRTGDAVWEDIEKRSRRLSAVEQLNRHARLVLLGGPGSGKSTFTSFVSLCLAGAELDDPQLNLDLLTAPLPVEEEQRRQEKEQPERQPWNHGALLPLRIVLRDFAARGLPPVGQAATVEHLWQFTQSELAVAGLADYSPYLRKHLLNHGGLLLLDGLDEVPEADDRRVQIKQVVTGFAAAFRQCRILVTSRTYAYQNQDWRLPGFAEAVLEPFSRQQIRAFIDRWYAHVAAVRHRSPEDMQGRAEVLKQRVFANDRLYALAEQPLLLTLMASLHAWRGGNLPENREELYADAVELLLDLWENQRIVRGTNGEIKQIDPSLAECLRVSPKRILLQLQRLAFDAHANQPALTGTADIAEKDLVQALLSISDRETRQVLLIEYLSNRAGLLAPRGNGVYTLPHRTFQEYLAACHLTDDDFPNKLAQLARQEPERWREVVLLAGAKAARGARSTIWSLVNALSFSFPGDAGYCAADDWGALLAGQALVESADLAHIHQNNQRMLQCVREGLLHALRGNVLPAVDRALAGQALSKLDDTRPEVLDPLRMEFCLVPAGPFVMGDGKEQHEYNVPYEYWIARYPVTVAQFAAFQAAGGYAEANYWTEAQKAGFWKDGQFRDRDRPYQFGEPFDLPNHPVVGVSWYEALAFVRWLNDVSSLPAGYALQLPNEPEWEKAARGGLDVLSGEPIPLAEIGRAARPAALQPNKLPKRRYPWSDDPDPQRANYDDTKIGSTSAVGCFVSGASPYGVEELSGNAWEWTRSHYVDYPYPANGRQIAEREDLGANSDTWRVLRGGAFGYLDLSAACAARLRFSPYDLNWFLGFRVVLSPFTSGL